ncbi:MAG TPA: hypothetical protein VFB13_06020 [Reyranella sp.]|nr:hypothetical protein [Reyranella sp.]
MTSLRPLLLCALLALGACADSGGANLATVGPTSMSCDRLQVLNGAGYVRPCYDGTLRVLNAPYDGTHRRLDAPYDGTHRQIDAPYDGTQRRIDAPYDGTVRRLDVPYDGTIREIPCP